MPHSPLAISSTTHQVSWRMLSPSIATIASVIRSTISRFCWAVKTPSTTLIWMNGMLPSWLERGRGSSSVRSFPCTSGTPLDIPPEHCVAIGIPHTIGELMDQSVVAGPAMLLEREHEVERVRAALRAVGRRDGGIVVIEGAA